MPISVEAGVAGNVDVIFFRLEAQKVDLYYRLSFIHFT